MSNSSRRPILYKGELYSVPVSKKPGGGSKKMPITYSEARDKIRTDLDKVSETLKELPEGSRLPHEVVMCVRMHPDFSAKSYYPATLFDGDSERFGLEEIGSRIWYTSVKKDNENEHNEQGKLFFVRGTEASIDKFKKQLDKPESSLKKNFTNDIRKLVGIDLLSEEEQISGISNDWEHGRLEAVLHPFDIDQELALKQFANLLQIAGADLSQVKFRQYEGGITFVSLYGDRDVLTILSGYNPLRTLHPLVARDFSSIERGQPLAGAPLPPVFTRKPSVVVGVIDGGYQAGNPALDPYVEIEDCVPGVAVPYYADHGTNVTSAVLYGPLNKYRNADQLPEPSVCVKNFRVLSKDSGSDPDLYEVIDAIEMIVPKNEQIKVYNLSIGPAGQILDDHISRFTFACDLLIQKYNILFCTAVGNDGDLVGYNRIQAPSDMVNGLAIGAYSKVDGHITRAPYSCIGPGREGNKLKPDLAAFGGCSQNPIQLLGDQPNVRIATQGTSFSSPIASATNAQLIGYSESVINSLIARVLVIHGVSENSRSHCYELGHGTLPDDITQLVSCPTHSYTLIYNGEIEPGKYVELPIPWTNEIRKGKAIFRWTVAVLTNVDPQSPDDYSTSSIVTSFYPNTSKFRFKKGTKVKVVDIDSEANQVVELLADGWSKDAVFPVSESGQTPYQAENSLRADFKWDTLDSRRKNKNVDMVKNPMFHLHALERGQRHNSNKVKYALVLTVETTSAEVDLYSKVRANYTALVPISLDIQGRVSATV